MAIFLIVPIAGPDSIEQQLLTLKASEKLDFLKLPTSGFAVSFSGTTQELSSPAGISEGTTGTGMVAAVSTYYGRAPIDIWDWINSRWEA